MSLSRYLDMLDIPHNDMINLQTTPKKKKNKKEINKFDKIN